MSTTHQTATVTAVAALALALSLGAATAPAQAAPYLNMTCNITHHTVDGTNYDVWLIDVQGVVTMSQAAAQDSINHGHTIQLRYWGDDPSDDDLIYGPIAAPNVFAAADGLHFQYNVNFPRSQLNEDDSILDNAVTGPYNDEIYVGARFVDPYGKTLSLVESKRISENF